jgi:Uma2 family endonuclease
MSIASPEFPDVDATLPDHTQLPDSDGSIVENFQQLPQSMLLSDSITPVLRRIHPDANYCIGGDSGIYWKLTVPLVQGAIAPDWLYVPNVPPTLGGRLRRSYVLWKEHKPPLLVLEYVSGDGSEERDTTPETGKLWIYERRVRAQYYGIYEVDPGQIEMYHLVDGRYERMEPNANGRYLIPEMQVELGIWDGPYANAILPWMRWWDPEGNLLRTGEERAAEEQARVNQEQVRADRERVRAEQERVRAEQERMRADQFKRRNDQLVAQLEALGIKPEP